MPNGSTKTAVFLLLATLLISGPCFSQHPHDHIMITSGTQRQLPGSINGATSPDLIPDVVAYRLFLKVLLNTPGSTADLLDRQRAVLRPAKLSEQDFIEVKYVVEAFGKAMSNHIQDRYSAEHKPGGIDAATATLLNEQRDRSTEDAKGNLETHLSAEGMKRLHNLILSEKVNMTAIVGPMMPTGATK